MTMTREEVEHLLKTAGPGPWDVDGPVWNRTVWRSSENRVCFMAHSNGLNDDRDMATSRLVAAAPDLARALLATMTELEQVKGERDALEADMSAGSFYKEADANWLVSRAEAAETALAAMTEREGVLRAFIDDFATAKIDALRYQPSYGESPEDEPDPVVDATEVWAWQSDAKDILALKETPDA